MRLLHVGNDSLNLKRRIVTNQVLYFRVNLALHSIAAKQAAYDRDDNNEQWRYGKDGIVA